MLTINKVWAIIAVNLLSSFLKIFGLFIVGIFIPLIVNPYDPSKNGPLNTLLDIALLMFPSALLITYLVIDAYLFAKHTRVSKVENGLSFESKSITKSTKIVIPMSDLKSIEVHQNFIQKIFGVGYLNILSTDRQTGVYGFDIDKLREFSDSVSKEIRQVVSVRNSN